MTAWTEERRRKQAEAIRRWKPWEKSTGPKTPEGKNKVRMNAFKHGDYAAWSREIETALYHSRQFLRYVERWAEAERELTRMKNKLLEKQDKTI